jgi:hypothetical protein
MMLAHAWDSWPLIETHNASSNDAQHRLIRGHQNDKNFKAIELACPAKKMISVHFDDPACWPKSFSQIDSPDRELHFGTDEFDTNSEHTKMKKVTLSKPFWHFQNQRDELHRWAKNFENRLTRSRESRAHVKMCILVGAFSTQATCFTKKVVCLSASDLANCTATVPLPITNRLLFPMWSQIYFSFFILTSPSLTKCCFQTVTNILSWICKSRMATLLNQRERQVASSHFFGELSQSRQLFWFYWKNAILSR